MILKTFEIEKIDIKKNNFFLFYGENQGLKSEIFAPPHPEYTALLLSSVPEMDPDWLTELLNARNS